MVDFIENPFTLPPAVASKAQSEAQIRSQHTCAYERLLAECCHYDGIVSLLTQHRPYFEALPSIRRLQESMVLMPLPNVRSKERVETAQGFDMCWRIRPLPCDLTLMVCDPEWKIKLGIEIVLLIQRPGEDFSDLLLRWRLTQAELGQGVEWLLPRQHQHLLSDGAQTPHPLFVVFTGEMEAVKARCDRILHGLKGARLPVAICPM